VNDIRAGGRRPFLNVAVENVRARRLYERLGFKDRMQMTVRVLQPSGDPATITCRAQGR
jgi:predicted GNAT family acetyltransferase